MKTQGEKKRMETKRKICEQSDNRQLKRQANDVIKKKKKLQELYKIRYFHQLLSRRYPMKDNLSCQVKIPGDTLIQ